MKNLLLKIPLIIIALNLLLFAQVNKSFTPSFNDGTIDVGFNNGGVSLFGYRYIDHVVQSDNKIIGLGVSLNTDTYANEYSLQRLNPDGDPDGTFGHKGKIIIEVEDLMEVTSMALQDDEKVLVTGFYSHIYDQTSYYPRDTAVFVARYNNDGSIDETFGTDGYTFVDFSFFESITQDYPFELLLQSDGKIVVCSRTDRIDYYPIYEPNPSVITDTYFSTFRLDTSGEIDLSFGSNGKVLTPAGYTNFFYSPGDYIFNIPNALITPDDKIVVAHGVSPGADNYGRKTDLMIVQYDQDGEIDKAFGNNGIINHVAGTYIKFLTLAIQNDGKLLAVTEHSGSGRLNEQPIFRFNLDGSLDFTFSDEKGKTLDIGANLYYLFPDNDKLIVVGGRPSFLGTTGTVIQRYDSDMELDTSFGVDGTRFIQLSSVRKLVRQTDNHILVGTKFSQYSSGVMAFNRLLMNPTNSGKLKEDRK